MGHLDPVAHSAKQKYAVTGQHNQLPGQELLPNILWPFQLLVQFLSQSLVRGPVESLGGILLYLFRSYLLYFPVSLFGLWAGHLLFPKWESIISRPYDAVVSVREHS